MQLPDPTLGLLIVSARHAIRQAIGSRARRFRLTTPQFWAVYCLRRLPGLTPGDLAHWMQLDAPAASRLVADLSKRKLLDVRPDRDDRRRTRLFLSEKAQPLAEKVDQIAQEYHQAITRGMEADEVEALRSGLRKVIENLAEDAEPAAPRPASRSRRPARAG